MDSDAHITTLLHSNLLPDEITVVKINAHLRGLHENASSLDADILRLEEKISDLRKEREKAQLLTDDYHIILSPARRVPEDVWREIFYCCVPTHRDATMCPKEAPLLLALVCNSWRRIALSSPRIWSTLYIPFVVDHLVTLPSACMRPEYVEKIKRDLEEARELRCRAIEKWIGLSGDCPLSLTFVCTSYAINHVGEVPDDLGNISHVCQIFRILYPSTKRWAHIELHLGPRLVSMFQDWFPATSLTALKSMAASLHTFRYPYFTSGFLPDSGPPPIPTLRELAIAEGHASRIDVCPLPLALRFLTDIHLYIAVPIKSIFQLLHNSHQLINFSVCLAAVGPSQESFDDHDPGCVELPHLRTLRIDDHASNVHPVSDTQKEFFERIWAPALHRFSYRRPSMRRSRPFYNYSWMCDEEEVFISPFLSCSPALEILSIDPYTLSWLDIFYCLCNGQQVKKLVLGHDKELDKYLLYGFFGSDSLSAYPDAFDLRYLAVPMSRSDGRILDGMPILVPKLEILVVYRLTELTDDDLLMTIKSRLRAGKEGKVSTLKHVEVEFCREMQKDVKLDIIRYAEKLGLEEGQLKLELKYGVETPVPGRTRCLHCVG